MILIGHLTRTAISKDNGEEIDAADINLTGKLKVTVAADMDAIGKLIRKDNQSILSFKVSPNDLISGSRREHLANKEIVVSEKTEDGFKYYWERIFTK